MRKSLLKTVVATAIAVTATVVSGVSVFAATITSTDDTVLTGNYADANAIKENAENCTVTVNSDNAVYAYTLNSTGTRTGLIITNVNTSSGKLDKDDSAVTFTTDGDFDIVLGDESISKNTADNLVLTKSDATDATELTVSSSKRVASATGVEAGTYSITGANKSTYLPTIKITVAATEVATYDNGIITLTNDSTKGSVALANGDTAIPVDASTNKTGTITGGTSVTATITPESGYYVSSVTVNGTEANLTNNKVDIFINGNASVVVNYESLGEFLTIDDDIAYIAGETEDLVKQYNVNKSTDYYFELTKDATLETGNRINVGGGNANSKSIIFNVGEKENLQAFVTVEYASSSASETRYVKVGSSSSPVQDSVGTASEKRTYTVPVYAGTNLVTSKSGTLYIYSVKVSFGTASTLNSVGDDYYTIDASNLYIIHVVTDEEMAKDSLYLKNGENKVAETRTVYTGVKFDDNSELTSADDFGGSKIYVVKVNGASADDIKATTAFTWGTTPAEA